MEKLGARPSLGPHHLPRREALSGFKPTAASNSALNLCASVNFNATIGHPLPMSSCRRL